MRSTAVSGELAVPGVTSGLLGPGDQVTWSARHFVIRQRLTSRITVYDRPHHFRDSMVQGAFARFDHDHTFEPVGDGTRMVDEFDFASRLGPLGRLVDRLVLTEYMRRLLIERAATVKAIAESEDWRLYLPAT